MTNEFEIQKTETQPLAPPRAGMGRPKGVKNKSTIIKEAAQELVAEQQSLQLQKDIRNFHERTSKQIDKILTAQYSLAVGNQYLFRVDKTINENGKAGPDKHVLVTDPNEIRRYLDEETEDQYYYITTDKPDNAAVEAILNRYMGKAPQTLQVPGTDGKNKQPTQIAIINYGDDTATT